MILKIKGVVKEYEWGSYDFLPSIFGYDVDNKPQAEAWFGTYQNGCALIENGLTLKEIIKNNPEKLLGDHCYKKYGAELPILLKILAVRTPLSIKCHPSADYAKAGFEAEETGRDEGTPSSELDFRDPNGKSELFYALSPVTVLCGFRSMDDIQEDLKRVMPYSFTDILAEDSTAEALLGHLFSLTQEEKKRCIEELVSNMVFEKEASDPRFLGRREIVQRSYKLFGTDIGIIIVYMLNLIWLENGDSLYLPPGTVHSYIFGNGIELMNLSDNSVRGGLTRKHTNPSELMRMMDSSPSDTYRCSIMEDAYKRNKIMAPEHDFSLFHLTSGSYTVREKTPSLILTTHMGAEIRSKDGHVILSQGECCFISADEEDYTIDVAGEAFQASVAADEREEF